MKSSKDSIAISEITSKGVKLSKSNTEFNFNTGCAGIAFKTKEPVFEPFAQSSNKLSQHEIDTKVLRTVVQNIIAVPIFDEEENSIGVFEAINSDRTIFSETKKPLLLRFAKYISLIYYTNTLLMVILCMMR
jgi:hypothetical protein